MNKCIYLGDDANLTYRNKEHVISAALGGKNKLPHGYVSDKANMLFSKYELKCLRYSPLMNARVKYGPAKRGSLKLDSIDIPDVHTLEPYPRQTEYYICPLGFLFKEKAYILPQLILIPNKNGKLMSATLNSTYLSLNQRINFINWLICLIIQNYHLYALDAIINHGILLIQLKIIQ